MNRFVGSGTFLQRNLTLNDILFSLEEVDFNVVAYTDKGGGGVPGILRSIF